MITIMMMTTTTTTATTAPTARHRRQWRDHECNGATTAAEKSRPEGACHGSQPTDQQEKKDKKDDHHHKIVCMRRGEKGRGESLRGKSASVSGTRVEAALVLEADKGERSAHSAKSLEYV